MLQAMLSTVSSMSFARLSTRYYTKDVDMSAAHHRRVVVWGRSEATNNLTEISPLSHIDRDLEFCLQGSGYRNILTDNVTDRSCI
jgi:hypothetical protein